ncbi:MAG: siroheme synthase [Candidatus Rokuibacteriota bacterium]|nr:MAG: siroheme synthase [Candidatus Rokubacteria bacterium]
MASYPVVLDLGGRSVLVVGGGAVAERKVEGLLAAEATVTVVSPRVTVALALLANEGRIRVRFRSYRPADLRGQVLVLAATNDRGVNARVAADARRRRVWVNAADDPEHCDFLLPSVLRRGSLLVSVTTGGRSPALARVVREDLERVFGSDYALLTDLAGEVRRELHARGEKATAKAWTQALRGDVRRLVAAGRRDDARRRLLQALRSA